MQQVADDRAAGSSVLAGETTSAVGAVVLGGDYQGLGVVRSLGREGIPVCVVDDEPSVARHSRYASHAVRARPLIREDEIIESLLDIGERFGLEGWVLYPTRDEIVDQRSTSARPDALPDTDGAPVFAGGCIVVSTTSCGMSVPPAILYAVPWHCVDVQYIVGS
jgi:hypothetical protein